MIDCEKKYLADLFSINKHAHTHAHAHTYTHTHTHIHADAYTHTILLVRSSRKRNLKRGSYMHKEG